LSAKAIAGGQMPLLRMDIGTIMASHIGESEDNMRRALKLADAIAPCVLWIDEVEKALGGVESSNSTDGGVTMRVFGTLLTYMQENTNPVYIVATANSTRGLKPEFLSRFDEVFFVDLPSYADRKEILLVHLGKRELDPAKFDLDVISSALWGYSLNVM
jgi:SpoVK/Ycf46/Vps4 family AAA+-type ATPase